jgi:hypothetical protein
MPAADTVFMVAASPLGDFVGDGVGFDAPFESPFESRRDAGADAAFGARLEAGFASGTETVAAGGGGSAAMAPSSSPAGCRAVINAAAARTHVIPMTMARQLYAFGGGGIGGPGAFDAAALAAGADFAAAASFPAPAIGAFVRLNRSESFRSESFLNRRSALSR